MPESDYRQNLTLADLDEHGCLRISIGLWLMIVLLSRHAILLLLGAVSSFASHTYGQTSASYGVLFSDPWFLLASAPALLVLAAGLRRVPSAPSFVRAVWRAGASLLILAVTLDLVILGILLGLAGWRVEVIHVSQAMLDTVALTLLVRSMRIRDTFADFPAPC